MLKHEPPVVYSALALAAVALAVSALSTTAHQADSQFEKNVVGLLKDLELLEGKGIDVRGLIHKLDEAIKLAELGEFDKAMGLVEEVRLEVALLKEVADRVYAYEAIRKYGLVIGILSIPALTYFLLPRAYLYLWFKCRRRWIVEERGGGGVSR